MIIVSTVTGMIVAIKKYKSPVFKMTFVGTVCYFINLWWLDALQTLKYEYIIIAIFYALYMYYEDNGNSRKNHDLAYVKEM